MIVKTSILAVSSTYERSRTDDLSVSRVNDFGIDRVYASFAHTIFFLSVGSVFDTFGMVIPVDAVTEVCVGATVVVIPVDAVTEVCVGAIVSVGGVFQQEERILSTRAR